MSDSTDKLLDSCFEQVYDVSHNPDNIAAAQVGGGVLAAGVTAGAALTAAIAAPQSILAAPAELMGVHQAYEYGVEYGPQVFIPLEVMATFVACAPGEAIDHTINLIYDQFSSIFAVSEPAMSPTNDAFSEAIGATVVGSAMDASNNAAPDVFSSPVPDAFASTPNVFDTVPTWDAVVSASPESSSSFSHATIDSSSNAGSESSHSDGAGATDN